eukprot:jgi/Chlat1/3756/Chrsp259S03900
MGCAALRHVALGGHRSLLVLGRSRAAVRRRSLPGGVVRQLHRQQHRSSAVQCAVMKPPPSRDKDTAPTKPRKESHTAVTVAGFNIEGISIGGQETSIILPQLKVVFDSGRCPQRSVYQPNMLVSHGHMDHSGGVPFYVATRGLLALAPPTVIVPRANASLFEQLIDIHRQLDGADLNHNLVPLSVGEQHTLSRELFVKPFATYHPVPSQGYVIYSRKFKLKEEYVGVPGPEIKRLREDGVEVTNTIDVPEVAFTGDTTAEFITNSANADVLRAKLLIMECTFVDDTVDREGAHRYGHTHIDDVVEHADLFQNSAILFIHFSARYSREQILQGLENKLPQSLRTRVTPLLEGFS